MRTLLGLLARAVLVNMLVSGPVLAAAGGIGLDQTVIKTFTDCSSSGSSAQTITGGDYLVTITDENTWLCIADSSSTCASGGTKLAIGMIRLTIGNTQGTRSLSCRSTNSTGDIQLTKAN